MKKIVTPLVLFIVLFLASVGSSFAQSLKLKGNIAPLHEIRLKSRIFTPSAQALQKGTSVIETGHMLIQFDGPVTSYEIGLLQDAGVRINGWVPNSAVAASVPDGVDIRSIPGIRWSGKLSSEDKLAETVNLEASEMHVLVDIFNDVDPFEGRRTLRAAGFDVISNRYLDRHTLLVATSGVNLRNLAGLDMVSYVYPASQAIIQGKPVHQCLGGMTRFGRIPNFVPNGNGWDGPGKGSFNLKYHFDNGTADVVGEVAEVVAAFRTWSNYADVSWSQTNTNNANNSIDIRWGADNHGDTFPFDGPSGVLAHCFYPDDINAEPLAGDLHFDEDETWQIGSDDIVNSKFELYTIALHEAGHGLGLNHSNDTTAVMFAFYSGAVGDLRQDDIDGIRSLYATKVIPRAAAPTFDPPPGTYESPIEVRVNYGPGTNFNNSQIKYTLNGDEPIAYSFSIIPDFGDYIFQRFSNTIKARTFGVGKTPSAVVEATYILIPATPTVAKPVITPNGGSHNGSVMVSISTSTEFAVIRATTDGSEPTASSFAYGGPFPVTSSTTVKAKAFRTDYSPSETATADFDILIQLPAPTIYPNGGIFVGPTTVYLGSTVLGAEIRYTLNGAMPTQTAQLFSGPLTINSNSTVSAVVFLDGYAPSPVAAADFVIAENVERPIITPPGGEFTGSVQVSLASPTPGVTLRYTTNGSNPTSFSTAYTTPFTLGIGSHFVKAVGLLNGANPSPFAVADFDVYDPNASQVQTPTMTPFSSQQFVNNFRMEMDCRTEGATIRYTVGIGQLPNDPTESGGASFTYTAPFTFGLVGNTYFFKVKAFKQGLPPSAQIQSGGLAVSTALGQVDTIAIIPNGGVFHNTLRITLETATASAQIVFTEDGTIPNTTLPILPPARTYNNSVLVAKAKTITARGRRTFFLDSAPNSAEFRLKCSTPEITPASGSFTDSMTVTLESETTGGNTRTYYTLDGSEPTEESLEYETPFTLLVGNHTVRAKTFRFNFEDGETAAAEYVVSLPAVASAITSDPQSQSVNPGENVTFQVVATGVPAPDYQWLRNGVVLPAETNSTLIIPNVQPGDSGSYRAVASNIAGVDTSEAAILSVAPIVNSVDLQHNNLPEAFDLAQNYPNPFNPTTTLRFSLPKSSQVKLEIYNMLGRKIRTLVNETRDAGFHEVKWDGKNAHGIQMTTGVYLYRISADRFVAIRKMILMK